MRRPAAATGADRPGERLPVPPTGDELERLGTTLNGMLGRLEAALERERGFVAEAGHELRTPLALLRAELDFALHHAETEAELRDALREASAETDRVVQLAGDLLLIASSDQNELPLRLEPIAAADLLESVRNRLAWWAAGETVYPGRRRRALRSAARRRRRRPRSALAPGRPARGRAAARTWRRCRGPWCRVAPRPRARAGSPARRAPPAAT